MRRFLITAACCVLLGSGFCLGDLMSAHANDGCAWTIQQTINTDPDPKDQKDESSVNGSMSTATQFIWALNEYVDVLELIPTWAWRGYIDADPWEINCTCQAYSGDWGFSSISSSITGAGQWIITRTSTCVSPAEDIEVNVRQQFHAEADLDADEKCEVRGVLKFWCSKTKSSTNPPGTINSVAKGGVSVDDDYGSDPTVTISFAGLSMALVANSGGSDTDDPEGHDAGNQGTSPETINTSTNVGWTMDLDSGDNCEGEINDVWWNVRVDCTCYGHCKNVWVAMSKNTYPSPPSGN